MGPPRWFSLRYGTISRYMLKLVASGPERSGIAVNDADLAIGAGDGLVELLFEPPMRARVLAFPVHVRRLRVSVDDPDGLVAALGVGGNG